LGEFPFCAAVLDNLPKVPHEKYDKLAGVVRKVISQVGVSIRGGAEGFHMPQGNDEQRMSRGYAFVEFNTPEVSVSSVITALVGSAFFQ
jgi:translation initiation factor 3 subunit B